MQPMPGSVASESQQAELLKQTNRIETLFKRQLALPLMSKSKFAYN